MDQHQNSFAETIERPPLPLPVRGLLFQGRQNSMSSLLITRLSTRLGLNGRPHDSSLVFSFFLRTLCPRLKGSARQIRFS